MRVTKDQTLNMEGKPANVDAVAEAEVKPEKILVGKRS